ncbi:MAG TPA: hypothetical protein VLY85_02880, partial [Thermoplasmata archaeon]|nr:hypothetical protein [Thermoplasmata archaeon]
MLDRRSLAVLVLLVGMALGGVVPGTGPAPGAALPSGPAGFHSASGPPSGPTYTVTFSETGLPAGTSWTVTLNGTAVSSTTSSLAFTASNGSYPYNVSNVPGWRANSYSGSVTVSGKNVSASVSWARVAYSVTFSETGLPNGTFWGVTLNGVLVTSTSSSIPFVEPNGTYAYSVTNVSGWRTLSGAGSVTVQGRAVTVPIAWNQTAYAVTFLETGLPTGTVWTATLSGGSRSSNASAIRFSEPNGTYAYNLSGLVGWRANVTAGSVVVNGFPVNVSVDWTPYTYPVTFTEAGLPSGTSWTVTLGGHPANSTTTTIVVPESNGSFAYSVGSIAGYSTSPAAAAVTVSGAPVAVAITFAAAAGSTYLVTFTETGLPSGTDWGATLGAVAASSTASTLAFRVPNGTLTYRIANVPGWRATTYSGSVTVNGKALGLPVTWAQVAYPVTFSESGLPAATSWAVALNGYLVSADTSSILFVEPNGTYAFNVSDVPGWSTPSYSGVLRVNGGSSSVTVAWIRVAYSVTFTETGLSSGTGWSVTLAGTMVSSTGSSVAFVEPNGSYSYSVASAIGWHPGTPTGSVTVNGAPASVAVSWSQAAYTVTFTEVGLPSASSWSVTFNGTLATSTTTSIAFSVPNGTFRYNVSNVPAWRASSYAGSVTVQGQSVAVPINWTRTTYSITFSEIGLPGATLWKVTLAGTALTSKSTTITFSVANGTYGYNVSGIPGWRPSASGGSATVAGRSVSVPITWVETTYRVSFAETGLPDGTPWAVTLAGRTLSSPTATVNFTEPNGTFSYNVSGLPGWRPDTTAGSVMVSAASVSIPIRWTEVLYELNFTESGLPKGTNWTVAVGGDART